MQIFNFYKKKKKEEEPLSMYVCAYLEASACVCIVKGEKIQLKSK